MTRPLPLFTQLRISSGGAAMVIWSWVNYSSDQGIFDEAEGCRNVPGQVPDQFAPCSIAQFLQKANVLTLPGWAGSF